MRRTIIGLGLLAGACFNLTCDTEPYVAPVPSFTAETSNFPGGLGVLFSDDEGPITTIVCYDFATFKGQECNTDLVVAQYVARYGA